MQKGPRPFPGKDTECLDSGAGHTDDSGGSFTSLHPGPIDPPRGRPQTGGTTALLIVPVPSLRREKEMEYYFLSKIVIKRRQLAFWFRILRDNEELI
ncbi:hypothetical protein HNY73_012458 [Argiope bruennichi]|uniref:Uncharacterized protein n=1 Tax=Argiope bruennichi TaxID=94029 RepID=A0A8T0EV11_ARGBR|nr:hypothetical protein HNY73_012458 [Argiope bruennichi]